MYHIFKCEKIKKEKRVSTLFSFLFHYLKFSLKYFSAISIASSSVLILSFLIWNFGNSASGSGSSDKYCVPNPYLPLLNLTTATIDLLL